MSGCVDSGGKLWDKEEYGSLSSASPVDKNNSRAFGFDEDGGRLDNDYCNRNIARPCLSLIK